MAATPVLFEGDEEVQYVYVSLPADLDPLAFGPGATVTIEGLATEHPVLRPAAVTSQPGNTSSMSSAPPAAGPPGASSSNSTVSATGSSSSTAALQGQYVDSLGSILLVKEQQTAPEQTAKPAYSYVGHTDKQLQFMKPS